MFEREIPKGVITWRRPGWLAPSGVATWRHEPAAQPVSEEATGRGARRSTLIRDRRGQSLVEFALVIPMVLLLFLGVFEISTYFYTRLTLRHSVMEASRFAITGARIEDEISGDTLSRAESIAEIYRRAAPTVPVDLEALVIDPPDGGQPGEIVVVTATYSYDFSLPLVDQFFPDGVEFNVRTAMRNEPSFQE